MSAPTPTRFPTCKSCGRPYVLRLKPGSDDEPGTWGWAKDCTHRAARSREYETAELARGLRRFLRAYGERVAGGDLADLDELAAIVNQARAALDRPAVELMAEQGYSNAEVGSALGITKQSVHLRYGEQVAQRRRTVALIGDQPPVGF